MSARLARLVIIAVALTSIGAAMADGLGAGTYGCFTRGGREILSRRFTVGDDGGYARGEQGGSISQKGRRIYFRGGALAGREGLILPDGGIRLSRTSYCFRLPEVPVPVAAPVPEVEPETPAAPPAKLIKVKRPAPDPHIIHIAP